MGRHSRIRIFRLVALIALLVYTLGNWTSIVRSQDETGETPPAEILDTGTLTETLTVTETPTNTSESATETPTPSETVLSIPATTTSTASATPYIIDDPRLDYPHVDSQIVIKYKAGSDSPISPAARRSVEESSTIDALNVSIIDVSPKLMPELLAQLASDPAVEWVEPNYIVHILETIPNDPSFPSQWGLARIKAPAAWDYSTGSSSITIAIIDTGVDYSHPDLDDKIIGGWDFVNGDAIAEDENGHGTAVAGVAAAESNNGTGVSGVSWGARILPVKVLDFSGNGTYEDLADGIIYATDAGAAVINLSLGASAPSQLLLDAITYAANAGVLIVAASGNSGSAGVLYPARYSQVIAVAGTDITNNVSSFSNYGSQIDIAAPGESIYSTQFGSAYSTRTGTSMAAPFVSGAAAILLGLPGNNAPSLVRQQMLGTALDIGPAGFDPYTGHGLLQLDYAIRVALNLVTYPPTAVTPDIFDPTATTNFLPPLAPTLTGLPTSLPIPSQAGTVFALLVSPTATMTPTFTLTPLGSGGLIPTSTLSPEAARMQNIQQFWNICLPIVAILLIIAGFGMFWYVRRLRRKEG